MRRWCEIVGCERPSELRSEGKRLDGLGHKPVEDPGAALARDLDQPRFAKDAEVVRDRRLREAERVELADAGVSAACEPVHDREPRRIGECLEARREILELLCTERRRS